jgi:pilus assembly protein CpaD
VWVFKCGFAFKNLHQTRKIMEYHMLRFSRSGLTGLRGVALAALSLSMTACAADRVVTGSTYSREYKERHPIILTDAPRTLDVFSTRTRGLDERQSAEVKAFVSDYRRMGRGSLMMQVPGNDPRARRTAETIRHLSGGVSMMTSSYHPEDPSMVSPVRLTFHALKAKVGGKCGTWPQDLGVSDPKFNANNLPYWDFGCSTQSNLASQIVDPLDLVRGRMEGAADSVRRSNDIQNLRQGKDPGTIRQDQTKINQSVAN